MYSYMKKITLVQAELFIYSKNMHKLPLLGIILTIILMSLLIYIALHTKSPIKTTNPSFNNKQPSQIKCADFLTQSDAQTFFNNRSLDFQHLDKDRDGIVCENLKT